MSSLRGSVRRTRAVCSPSRSGNVESSSAALNGQPAARAITIRSTAAPHDPVASTEAPHAVRISTRLSRLAALSSTTSRRAPPNARGVGRPPSGLRARSSLALNDTTVPVPTSLRASMPPPIISARRRAMVRPSPVPPKRRVVDTSACVNASKIASRRSAGIPTPVSCTTQRNTAPARTASGSTCTLTLT